MVSQQRCSTRKCKSIERSLRYRSRSWNLETFKTFTNCEVRVVQCEQYCPSSVQSYVNPFGVNVDIDHLVCLSSGVPVKNENAKNLLSMLNRGKEYYRTFVETYLNKKNITFHAPIKRNVIKGFKKGTIKKIPQEKNNVDVTS